MFALHETTRKRLCRTAFFALCLAPSLATAAWIVGHYLPGRTAALARQWGDRYHLEVQLADWSEPRPSLVRTGPVKLADPSTGVPFLHIDALESRRGGDARVLTAPEVVIDLDDLARLAQRIEFWLSRLPADAQECRIGKLVINADGHAPLVLHQFHCRIDRDAPGQIRLGAIAHQTPQPESDGTESPQPPLRLTWETAANEGNAVRTLTFDAKESPLPAHLLATAIPGFGNLGPAARFAGVAQWTFQPSTFHGVAQGRLDSVDLAATLPAGSPHQFTGTATVDLKEIVWSRSQLERLAGTVHAENGTVSRSLIAAAVQNLRCVQHSEGTRIEIDPANAAAVGEAATPTSDAARGAELLTLEQLACRFQLSEKGLTLWGDFPLDANVPAGTLAVSGVQPLLLQPQYVDLPPAAWIQFVAWPPQNQTWIPATPAALDLARRLLPRD